MLNMRNIIFSIQHIIQQVLKPMQINKL